MQNLVVLAICPRGISKIYQIFYFQKLIIGTKFNF